MPIFSFSVSPTVMMLCVSAGVNIICGPTEVQTEPLWNVVSGHSVFIILLSLCQIEHQSVIKFINKPWRFKVSPRRALMTAK